MPFIVATTKCSHHVEYALDGAKEIQRVLELSSVSATHFQSAVTEHLLAYKTCMLAQGRHDEVF